MKWMQEERRRGRDVDFVRSCVFVSVGLDLMGVGTYPDIDVRNVSYNVV